MDKFEAKLCGYVALAQYVASIGMAHILGASPIWSNVDIQIHDWRVPRELGRTGKKVCLFAKLIYVPGTRHIYKAMAEVNLVMGEGGEWVFRMMSIFLHHHRMSEYHGGNMFDISLEPGVETLTDFSSDQHEVDDPRLSYTVFIEPHSTRFPMPTTA